MLEFVLNDLAFTYSDLCMKLCLKVLCFKVKKLDLQKFNVYDLFYLIEEICPSLSVLGKLFNYWVRYGQFFLWVHDYT